MQKKKVALATCRKLPELAPDDRLLLPELARLGIEAVPLAWEDSRPERERFDAWAIRSTWNYTLRYPKFMEWLDRLEASGARVWNPVPVLRWNSDKGYLRGLEKAGIPGIPTVWVGSPREIKHAIEEVEAAGWGTVVLKPSVSADGRKTFRIGLPRGRDSLRRKCELILGGPSGKGAPGCAMIQPFLPEIAEAGELSFLFYGGKLSHAVLKRPGKGDFRVQGKYGGTQAPYRPSPTEIAAAERALAGAGQGELLYARVDMIPTARGLLLGELELLEPSLYLAHDSLAAQRLAKAISERV